MCGRERKLCYLGQATTHCRIVTSPSSNMQAASSTVTPGQMCSIFSAVHQIKLWTKPEGYLTIGGVSLVEMGQNSGWALQAGCRIYPRILPTTRNKTPVAWPAPSPSFLPHTGVRMINFQAALDLIGENEEKALALTTQSRRGKGESNFNCSITLFSLPFPSSSLCLDMSLLLPVDDFSFPCALSLGPQRTAGSRMAEQCRNRSGTSALEGDKACQSSESKSKMGTSSCSFL